MTVRQHARALQRAVAATTLALACAAPLVRAQAVAVNGLDFGSILSGATTSVLPTAPGAMLFTITALLDLQTTVTLTLPATLSRAGGGTLPITFCSTCGVHRQNNSNPAGGTVFNPAATLTFTSVTSVTQYVWLGASISPPLAQLPGAYTGTVVITFARII